MGNSQQLCFQRHIPIAHTLLSSNGCLLVTTSPMWIIQTWILCTKQPSTLGAAPNMCREQHVFQNRKASRLAMQNFTIWCSCLHPPSQYLHAWNFDHNWQEQVYSATRNHHTPDHRVSVLKQLVHSVLASTARILNHLLPPQIKEATITKRLKWELPIPAVVVIAS